MNKTTRDNLSTAMNSEAFTYAKYKLFAERARRTGNPELAQLLETTAQEELLEHFAEEAALAEIVRSDVDNLEDAIASESYGVESMYRDFAEQAFSAGDKAVAERFEKIRHDEMKHRDAFKEALSKVAKNQVRPMVSVTEGTQSYRPDAVDSFGTFSETTPQADCRASRVFVPLAHR